MLKTKITSALFLTLIFLVSTSSVICQSQETKPNKGLEGMALLEKGQVKEAFEILKEDYEEALKSGKEDFQLANSINNLGEFYRRINRLNDAESFFLKAIEISTKISETVIESAAKNNLGVVYTAQKKYDEALKVLDEALLKRRKLYGEESTEVAITLDNIGLAYASKKNYPKAEEFTKKALAIFEKKGGIANIDTIIATNNLAAFYKEQGKTDEAINLYQRQFDLTEKEFGSDSPKLIEPIANLASLYVNDKDFKKTESVFRRYLTLLEKNNYAAYPRKVYALTMLGFYLNKQDKKVEAEEYFRKAIEGIDVETAKKSPNVVNIAVSIYVTFLKENKRNEEATALEDKIKKMFN